MADQQDQTVDWDTFDAILFDLDGVITPTADVHRRAWGKLFTDYFSAHGVTPAYTDDDYLQYIDGKPRFDGVRSALASRNLELPEGEPTDTPDKETVAGLGNKKNEVFISILESEGVEAYPGSVALVDALLQAGKKLAIVSSSKNAVPVLEAAGLKDRFQIIVDGNVSAQQGLAGKPSPETFLFGAEKLGVSPERAVVFEDAISGVQAGHAGDFGLVVGVDRGAGVDGLSKAGASIVVSDLAQLLPGKVTQ